MIIFCRRESKKPAQRSDIDLSKRQCLAAALDLLPDSLRGSSLPSYKGRGWSNANVDEHEPEDLVKAELDSGEVGDETMVEMNNCLRGQVESRSDFAHPARHTRLPNSF